MNNNFYVRTALMFFVCLFYPAMTVALPPPFNVCIDYHCEARSLVTLSNEQWREVRAYFLLEVTAKEERKRIRQAIAMLEDQVGQITGTWRDLGENYREAGEGQLDCISESKNTTFYLSLLENEGLLRWHQVEKRRSRRVWFFGMHWTAVIRDQLTGTSYAVDSWFLDNGQLPYIQRLDLWLSGRSFD